MTAALTAFRRTLKPLTLAPKSITLSERRAWQVFLDNGIWLDLGRQDALPRLSKFANSWQNDLSRLPFRIEYVDLRYPNGLAVKMPDYKPSKAAKLKPAA
jgi:cell division protein FtsQ